MMTSRGRRVQPDSPARASEAAISERNLRRETASSQAHACRGNSRCSISSKAGSAASSSRLRQYCLPCATLSRSRNSSRSIGVFIGAPGVASAVAGVAGRLLPDGVLLDEFPAHLELALILLPALGVLDVAEA